jgi:hypothetical protein
MRPSYLHDSPADSNAFLHFASILINVARPYQLGGSGSKGSNSSYWGDPNKPGELG